MGFKEDLDKWITREPYDDGFDNWCEQIDNEISDEFYDLHTDWLNEYDGISNKWMNKLFNKGYSSTEASIIIERGFNLYKLETI